MNLRLIGAFLILLCGCSSTGTRQIASVNTPAPETDVIALYSPLDEDSGDLIQKAHTVYDAQTIVENYHKSTKEIVVKEMAGPYEFYIVKKDENLKTIAETIYGDDSKSSLIHSWNYGILKTEDDIRPGMKIKFLPPSRMPASTGSNK